MPVHHRDWIEVEPTYFSNRELGPRINPWTNGTLAFRAIAYGFAFMLVFSAILPW